MAVTIAPAETATKPLLLRLTYFEGGEVEAPLLPDVAAALTQAQAYLDAAAKLETSENWKGRHPERFPATARASLQLPLLSVEMKSPLVILLLLPAVAFKSLPYLLTLAERIATAAPRVARVRKEEIVKREALDIVQENLRSGRADALASQVLELGPRSGPSRIDFVDPDDEDGDDLHVV